ncbi:MAG: hypothetical protein Q8P81_03610 [Nanoarchaeota archaeon]|nr:hypothetical protein [Nanoarchaeota archaeon]
MIGQLIKNKAPFQIVIEHLPVTHIDYGKIYMVPTNSIGLILNEDNEEKHQAGIYWFKLGLKTRYNNLPKYILDTLEILS